jgi:hypothetical protein
MGSVAKLMLAQTRGSSAQTRLVRSCDVHDLQVGSNQPAGRGWMIRHVTRAKVGRGPWFVINSAMTSNVYEAFPSDA